LQGFWESVVSECYSH